MSHLGGSCKNKQLSTFSLALVIFEDPSVPDYILDV